MDAFGKTFSALFVLVFLANIAFWGAIIYVAYRTLTHFGIL